MTLEAPPTLEGLADLQGANITGPRVTLAQYDYKFLNSSSSSDDEVESAPNANASKNREELDRLIGLRDELNRQLKDLLQPVKPATLEHQRKMSELSSRAVVAMKQLDGVKRHCVELEAEIKAHPPMAVKEPPPKERVDGDSALQAERAKNSIWKAELSKVKRVIAQEGGCHKRAVMIAQLRTEVVQTTTPVPVARVAESPGRGSQDIVQLRAEISELTRLEERARLTLSGLKARIGVLTANRELRDLLAKQRAQNALNDREIECLRPKEKCEGVREPERDDHVVLRNRMRGVILGLAAEVAQREQRSSGTIQHELELVQTRLHLLESVSWTGSAQKR